MFERRAEQFSLTNRCYTGNNNDHAGMQWFSAIKRKKVRTIVCYKRVVPRADGGHKLPVFRTAETEIGDVVGHVTAACASSTRDACKHSSIKSFTVTPQGHGYAGLQESVFVLPKGGKPDARGAERLGHKAERARLSLYQGLGNPLGSLLASLLGSTCRQ